MESKNEKIHPKTTALLTASELSAHISKQLVKYSPRISARRILSEQLDARRRLSWKLEYLKDIPLFAIFEKGGELECGCPLYPMLKKGITEEELKDIFDWSLRELISRLKKRYYRIFLRILARMPQIPAMAALIAILGIGSGVSNMLSHHHCHASDPNSCTDNAHPFQHSDQHCAGQCAVCEISIPSHSQLIHPICCIQQGHKDPQCGAGSPTFSTIIFGSSSHKEVIQLLLEHGSELGEPVLINKEPPAEPSHSAIPPCRVLQVSVNTPLGNFLFHLDTATTFQELIALVTRELEKKSAWESRSFYLLCGTKPISSREMPLGSLDCSEPILRFQAIMGLPGGEP